MTLKEAVVPVAAVTVSKNCNESSLKALSRGAPAAKRGKSRMYPMVLRQADVSLIRSSCSHMYRRSYLRASAVLIEEAEAVTVKRRSFLVKPHSFSSSSLKYYPRLIVTLW